MTGGFLFRSWLSFFPSSGNAGSGAFRRRDAGQMHAHIHRDGRLDDDLVLFPGVDLNPQPAALSSGPPESTYRNSFHTTSSREHLGSRAAGIRDEPERFCAVDEDVSQNSELARDLVTRRPYDLVAQKGHHDLRTPVGPGSLRHNLFPASTQRTPEVTLRADRWRHQAGPAPSARPFRRT